MKWPFAVVLMVSQAGAQPQLASVRPKIQALYDQSTSLLVKKDLHKLGDFFIQTRTTDFTYTAPGKPNRKLPEIIASMKSVLGAYNVRKATVKIEDLKVNAASTVATITTVIELTSQSPTEKRIHTISQTVHGVDVWVQIKGSWKLKLSHVVSENLIRDGRAVTN